VIGQVPNSIVEGASKTDITSQDKEREGRPQPEESGHEPHLNQISPVVMDHSAQEKGHELQKLLRQFRKTTTSPLSGFVLQTLKNKHPA
jgi:hypothetical protein